MIQTLRNTLSGLVLAGAISFALTASATAQGLRTNQGSFGSGWQVGSSSTDTSPYSGSTGAANSSSGYGSSSSAGYGSSAGSSGSSSSYGGSSSYSGTSGNYGSTSSSDASSTAGSNNPPSAPRPAGGGLRVQ